MLVPTFSLLLRHDVDLGAFLLRLLTVLPPDKDKSEPLAEADFKPARWFPKGMRERLRHAASKDRKTRRVRSRRVAGVMEYSATDAKRWWPDEFDGA